MVFTLCIPMYSFDALLFVNFLLLPCSHFLLILIVNFCVLLFYFLFLFFSCLSGCYFSLVFPVFSHLVSCLCLSLLSSVFSRFQFFASYFIPLLFEPHYWIFVISWTVSLLQLQRFAPTIFAICDNVLHSGRHFHKKICQHVSRIQVS